MSIGFRIAICGVERSSRPLFFAGRMFRLRNNDSYMVNSTLPSSLEKKHFEMFRENTDGKRRRHGARATDVPGKIAGVPKSVADKNKSSYAAHRSVSFHSVHF
jgi:hypothetical protein